MTSRIWLILLLLTTTAVLLLVPIHTSSAPQTTLPEANNAVSRATSTPPTPPKPTLNPALVRICSCESTGRPDRTPIQFNPDGSVVTGKINPHDKGMCQVNTDYHGEAAAAMGLDLLTEAGNILYANYLYETQGTTPWNWSKSCWQ